MTTKTRHQRLALGMVGLLAAACSSVTRLPAGSAGSQVLGSAPFTQTPAPGGSAVPLPTGGPGASLPPVGGTSGGVIGSTSGSSSGSATGGGATRAACPTPLKLGVSFASDQASAASAAGYGNPGEFGNYANNIRALLQVGITDANKRDLGNGCKFALALHDFSTTGSNTYDAETQKECDDFAKDQKVFAVLPQTLETRTLVPCLSRYGIPTIITQSGQPMPTTTADYASGTMLSPSGIPWDRLGGEVSLLQSAGFFGTGAKVGILITDDGRGINKQLAKTWRTKLQALGHSVVSTFTAPPLSAFSQATQLGSDAGNAALQFRRDGVDHVLFTPLSGGISYFFIRAADGQGYHPKLGMDTLSRPEIFYDSPTASKVGAMAVSWELFDTANQSRKPAVPGNASRTHCTAIYRQPAAAAGVSLEQMFTWCATLEMLGQALRARVGQPTAATLVQGLDALRSPLPTASGVGPSRFAARQYAGGQQVRVLKWDSGTDAWVTASGIEALP